MIPGATAGARRRASGSSLSAPDTAHAVELGTLAVARTAADTASGADTASLVSGGTVAWRSASSAVDYPGAGSATSVTLDKPAGVANLDILVAFLHLEDNTSKTITCPSGWTVLCSLSTGDLLTGYVIWKRAGSSEPSTYSFSWTGGVYVTGNILAFSGAVSTGSPWGGFGQNNDFTSGITSVSYTTTGTGLGIWLHTSFYDGQTIGQPSGYTLRDTQYFGSLTLADRADSTSGSKTSGAGTTSAGGVQRYTFAGTLLS